MQICGVLGHAIVIQKIINRVNTVIFVGQISLTVRNLDVAKERREKKGFAPKLRFVCSKNDLFKWHGEKPV